MAADARAGGGNAEEVHPGMRLRAVARWGALVLAGLALVAGGRAVAQLPADDPADKRAEGAAGRPRSTSTTFAAQCHRRAMVPRADWEETAHAAGGNGGGASGPLSWRYRRRRAFGAAAPSAR